MIFLYLFYTFCKIGLFGFGGGYAMLSMIQGEVVTRYNWISASEFTDIIAISQMTPGPIGINSATYVGYTAVLNAGYNESWAISGLVIVPVLSTHNTLTLASVSTQFISCTNTLLLASFLTLTTKATLASRYRPSGIIPTSEATIDTTLFFIVCPRKKWLCTYIIIPSGTITTPIIFTRLSKDFIISVFLWHLSDFRVLT